MLTMTEPKRKTACVKGFDVDLYEKVKAQAKRKACWLGTGSSVR
jgi:hypothetical protein